jgi:8-oxo-dGTP diphosphatase
MALVKCRTLFNQEKYIDSDLFIQRPSVYGLIIHEQKLLLAQASYTQKYVLPGGGIEKGEAIEAALMREIAEETGITVVVGEFVHFQTDLFYYDPLDLAIHGFMFYYQCVPLSTELPFIQHPDDEGLDRAMWVNVDDLHADSFQSHGELILSLIDRL